MATRRPSKKAPARRNPPPRRAGPTMAAVLVGAALGAGAVGFVWFRDGGQGTAETTTTTAVTTSTTTPAAPTSSTPTTAPSTTAPAPTTEPATTTTTQPPLRQISVVVGLDDGPERVDTVPLGSPVELLLTNPEADDEFHVHGYDLGAGTEVPAGETLTLSFVADRAGLFEVESHITHDVLLLLLVE